MKHKLFYRLFILVDFLFITLNSFADNFKQYNVYLISDTTADKYVKEFDDSLAKTNVLEKYKTTPFIKNHPVHLTLYLTSFQSKYIKDIESQLADLAKNTKSFYIKPLVLVLVKVAL